MSPPEYECLFPPDYESEEWLWESKGYVDVEVMTRTEPFRRFRVTVRSPVRLQQDIETEFGEGRSAFSEANSVVVPRVVKSAVVAALDELARRDFETLVPE